MQGQRNIAVFVFIGVTPTTASFQPVIIVISGAQTN